jgi:hypothetical protein
MSVLTVLEADYELRLICLGFHATVFHQIFARGAASWILMDRSLLIRNRELESNDIFVGRVDVFSDGLEAETLRLKLDVDFY